MPSLKQLRERSSMTQADLADELGVSYQLISAWERGIYMPRPANIRKICRVLRCKRDELEFAPAIPDARFVSADKDFIIRQQAEHIRELEELLQEEGLGEYIPKKEF